MDADHARHDGFGLRVGGLRLFARLPVVPRRFTRFPMKKLMLAGLAALAFVQAPAAFARPMTATDLATLRRLAAPAVSPDGNWLAYQLSETDLAGNRRRQDLWLLDLRSPGAGPTRIASTPAHNEHSPRFSTDGRTLYFLSNASGRDQLWRVATSGGTPERLTDFATAIAGFRLAPSGDRIAIWADLDLRCADFNCANVASPTDRGSARVYDQANVRFWDSWRRPGVQPRIFTLPLVDGRPQGAGTPVRIPDGGEPSLQSTGGGEAPEWSRDGRSLYFTWRPARLGEAGEENVDIHLAREGEGQTNLTAANRAVDRLPVSSPDGRMLAYAATRRPDVTSDRQVLMVRDLASGTTRALTLAWDRSIDSIAWAPDGRSLYVTAQDTLDTPLFRVDARSGRVTRLTEGGTVGNVTVLNDGAVAYTLNDITRPDDLHLWRGGRTRRLTSVNADVMAALDPVSAERFSFSGAGGDRVWGQIVKPANLAGRLPVAFLIHGGPQSSFGNAWSYRWNPRLFAAPGYAAVTVDFHGSTGYGQAFTDSITRDWGGRPLEDLRLGFAAAGRLDAQLDLANACALGGSYGGYMVNWIAGHWPDGFRCLVNHAGLFDIRDFSRVQDLPSFIRREMGGSYIDPAGAAAGERWNPANHVAAWRTPMLVIHGERDYRVPYNQGLAAYSVLRERGIPSRLVIFPDENHWVLSPRNSIQWYREVHGWLDQWLRQRPATAPNQ
jgi:dipeptidyl aminopeptidase/acylaminoacyl peptidase